MKRSSVLVLVFLAVVSALSMVYMGCGVQNPLEPNWGYPTPTFTPNIVSLPATIFNSAGAVAAWASNGNSTAPAGIGYNSGFANCSGSTGAMEVTIGFTSTNQAVFLQDQVSPAINMSGKTITVILQVASGWSSDSPQFYGQIFVQQSSVAGAGTANANLYQSSGGSFCSASCPGASSGCVTLTLTLPSSPTSASTGTYNIYGGTIDPSIIEYIGLQIGTGGSGSGFGSTVVDIKSWTYQ